MWSWRTLFRQEQSGCPARNIRSRDASRQLRRGCATAYKAIRSLQRMNSFLVAALSRHMKVLLLTSAFEGVKQTSLSQAVTSVDDPNSDMARERRPLLASTASRQEHGRTTPLSDFE